MTKRRITNLADGTADSDAATVGQVNTVNAAVTTNTSNIATNTSNISTNTTSIATNTAGVATNRTNIVSNTQNISSNTSSIATNTQDIASLNAALTQTNQRIDGLETKLNELDAVVEEYFHEVSAGIAGTVAINAATAGSPSAPGKTRLGLGTGFFNTESGVAMGFTHWVETEQDLHLMVTGGAAGTSETEVVYSFGVGVEF